MPKTLADKLTRKKLKKNQEMKRVLLQNEDGTIAISSSCNGTTDVTFESVKDLISAPVYEAVCSMGYTHLTEIQHQMIKCQLTSNAKPCVKAIAKTGSGKTLAYLLYLVELLQLANVRDFQGTYAIVVCPTRELARQTFGILIELLQNCTQKAALVTGGTRKKDEATSLYWGASIIVGTPGRLVDHLENTEGFEYRAFATLVIDEADRLLDMGFERDMRKIIALLKGTGKFQTLMFSATDSPSVNNLVNEAFCYKPRVLDLTAAEEQVTVSQLQQEFIICPSDKRLFLLCSMLSDFRNKKIMVFVNSGVCIAYYRRIVMHFGINVIRLHGGQTQEQRNKSFNTFNRKDSGVLMCTDIGSRGWDIPVVDLVIQFDPPDDPYEYIHRVGRTARGGREGRAIVILRDEEKEFTHFMHEHKVKLREIKVEWEDLDRKYKKTYDAVHERALESGFMQKVGMDAFRSYVRSYICCNAIMRHIFNKDNLSDLEAVGKSFMLKKLPFPKALDSLQNPIRKKKTFDDEKPYFNRKRNRTKDDQRDRQAQYKQTFKKSYKS